MAMMESNFRETNTVRRIIQPKSWLETCLLFSFSHSPPPVTFQANFLHLGTHISKFSAPELASYSVIEIG